MFQQTQSEEYNKETILENIARSDEWLFHSVCTLAKINIEKKIFNRPGYDFIYHLAMAGVPFDKIFEFLSTQWIDGKIGLFPKEAIISVISNTDDINKLVEIANAS